MKTARLSATISESPSRPSRSRIRCLGTVTILSVIAYDRFRKPLSGPGSIPTRKSRADVGSEVKGQTVTELVASNRSSWMITTGRGFPAYACPPAAVQTSPRFIRWSTPRSRPQTLDRHQHACCGRPHAIGDVPRRQIGVSARRAPRSGPDAAPPDVADRDGLGPLQRTIWRGESS